MDGEEYDSIQLQSLSEVTEIYYQLLKKEMESSAAETKRKNSFNGTLQEEAANHLTEFAEKNQITFFSQALAELLTLLEWHNEQKTPEMQESAIYNSLLRVEKAANNTSTWELCGQDCNGPLISVSTYEIIEIVPQSWKLEDYNSMFVKFFMNLLQVLKLECHSRIKRAVEAEMKIVCDGAKIYAEVLDERLTKETQNSLKSEVYKKVSPVEYLGHIAFQAGYKQMTDDTVDLYINVQKGQRLPARKFEMNELYVKLTLCPSSLFPNQVPLKSTSVTEDLDNPFFNQFFQFSNLPLDVLNMKGSVVQVLVVNQDKSFSAEAVLLLKLVQNMRGFTSLEFLPVYLMPLKKFDMSQISYQVLETRSRWDKNAKLFINSRNKIGKSPKTLLSCLPGKNTCSF
ncbi:hypothetical protein HNY73_012430 [Argiope bruennichi]|uniref:C2 domain-containing protein n=1 Tax=Argiope bruennichi TaxID=94029 RepID=A0A8T0F0K6_ARGBR|nr:hypothetical protein HNY73_012430 [Argiope bruennichi]